MNTVTRHKHANGVSALKTWPTSGNSLAADKRVLHSELISRVVPVLPVFPEPERLLVREPVSGSGKDDEPSSGR